jgi:hypothetical protein
MQLKYVWNSNRSIWHLFAVAILIAFSTTEIATTKLRHN